MTTKLQQAKSRPNFPCADVCKKQKMKSAALETVCAQPAFVNPKSRNP